MEQLQKKLVKEFNCTIPFISKHIRENTEICADPKVATKAIHVYQSSPIWTANLWVENGEFMAPCTYYKYESKEIFRQDPMDFYNNLNVVVLPNKSRDLITNTEGMLITFISRMTVVEQYWSYEFMAYVAENGGFVGLFLGYSVLHLCDLLEFLLGKIKANESFWGSTKSKV